ncbi:MAG: N-acetylmuramoyl-L-alanine amidase, partial [Rikenellaceae bacterium]
LKLGKLIEKELPHVKVVYTRTTDKHLSTVLAEDLHARTLIANNASGDLFISIHANAAKNTSAAGAETILMGETPLEQQRNESAIYAANRDELLDMSDEKTAAIVRAYIQNLQFTYGEYSEALARLIQKGYAADGRKTRALRYQLIKVLYGTDMPCVLTEIGFMSNPVEFSYMTSEKGQQQIAGSIFKGVKGYVEMVNKTQSAVVKPQTPSPRRAESKPTDEGYTIQILSSHKLLDNNSWEFKSYKGRQWLLTAAGRFKYKYCVGRFSTQEAAARELKAVREVFAGAFIVEFKNDTLKK